MIKHAILCAVVCIAVAPPLSAGVRTVTVTTVSTVIDGDTDSIGDLNSNPGADGKISIPEAITAANNNIAAENASHRIRILFDIPKTSSEFNSDINAWAIFLSDPLPPITCGKVTINGFSQTLNRGDTRSGGPEIVFIPSGFPSNYPGLGIRSSDNIIEGVGFWLMPSLGIDISGPGSDVVENNLVTGCELTGNNHGGVFLGQCRRCRITRCNATYNDQGILFHGATECRADENTFGMNNHGGIKLDNGSTKNVIEKNVITENGGPGIYCSGSDSRYNTFSQNIVYDNIPTGIITDRDANGDIPPPFFLAVHDGVLHGIAYPNSTVEFFEGRYGASRYLGSVKSAVNGDFSYVIPELTAGKRLTATVTDPSGSTSMLTQHYPPRLLVSESGIDSRPGNRVAEFDALSLEAVESIPVGNRPFGIYSTWWGGLFAAVNNDDDTLLLILRAENGGERARFTMAVGNEPLGIGVVGAGGDIRPYAVCAGDGESPGSIDFIATDEPSPAMGNSIPLGRSPVFRGAVLGDLVFVPTMGDDTISVVDASLMEVVGTLAAGDAPASVILHPDLRHLLVADYGDGYTDGVLIIDRVTGKILKKIFTGYGPISLARWGSYGIASNSFSDTVTFFDLSTMEIVRQVRVGRGPHQLTVDQAGTLYVPNFLSSLDGPGTVTLIDCNRVGTPGSDPVIGEIEGPWCPSHTVLNEPYVWCRTRPGLHLMAIPPGTWEQQMFYTPGGVVFAGVLIPGTVPRGDVSLGVWVPKNGRHIYFKRGSSGLGLAGPAAAGNGPAVARNIRLDEFRKFSFRLPFPEYAPAGLYAFFAEIRNPATGRIVQRVYSNYFLIAPPSLVDSTTGDAAAGRSLIPPGPFSPRALKMRITTEQGKVPAPPSA